MKRDRLVLSQHQTVETYRDANGRCFVAYSGGASVFIRDTKELRRFLKIPRSIPMRESLESWLASLEDMDAVRETARRDPQPALMPSCDPQNLAATGFGPEVFQDDADPTANTRTII